ncbi:MAG: helix-hairpin-helix domain-containing protein [Saprospiraceae bacterium]
MLKKQYLKSKTTCKVTFALPLEAAPEAKEVRVLGDFNGWSWQDGTPMKRSKTDYTATLELATGNRYEFRYMIDNEKWENDWQADDYAPTTYGVFNSVVEVSTPLQMSSTPDEIEEKAAAESLEAAKTKVRKPAGRKGSKKTDHVPDDLTKIEGIGPKIAQILNDRGIVTFADLANTDANIVKTMLIEASSRNRMHDPSSWSEQAQLAAAGDWDTLARLQSELKAGKR